MPRTKPQLAPDPSMRPPRPRGIDPEGYVGSLFEPAPMPKGAASLIGTKASRHTGTLARERSRVHAGAGGTGNRSGRDMAIEDLKAHMFRYVRSVGVGGTLQSVDFLNWLDAHQLRPEGVDMRCLGGLWLHLAEVGILEQIAHKPNGGGSGAKVSYGSTSRPVYRVIVLDATRTSWFAPAIRDQEAA